MMGRLGVSLVLGFLIFFSWPNASRAAEAYVPDVVGQFAAISDRAEAIGIKIGDSDNPDTCRHYQAMARSTAPGTPYFFLAKSGNKPEDVPACLAICEVGGVPIPCTSVGDDVGRLMVVRMGSRDTNGERLRSNRMARNTETEDPAPPEEDVIVKEILFDGQNGWPHYGHPGSLQLVGNVLNSGEDVAGLRDLELEPVLVAYGENCQPRLLAQLERRRAPRVTSRLTRIHLLQKTQREGKGDRRGRGRRLRERGDA